MFPKASGTVQQYHQLVVQEQGPRMQIGCSGLP